MAKTKTIENGQTCLEKRGFEERGIEIERNSYNDDDFSHQYSSSHPNAISEPDSVKGKGRNGSGHIHSLPYTGTPKTDINRIDYSNFTTVSTDGATIGGKYDIDKRDESEIRSLFKRDINEYSVINENAISNGNIHGKGTGIELDTTNGGGGYDVEARDNTVKLNYYNGFTQDYEYSSMNKNAISTPSDPFPYNMKGKGTRSSGHLHFMGYYGTPRGDMNTINYSNFMTFDNDGVTIGNAADTEMRNNLYLMRRYNSYDNNEYSSAHQDAMSNGEIIGKGTGIEMDTTNGGGAYDVRLRAEHLEQNEWKKDYIEYSKALIDVEYMVQTEFKVSTSDELVEEKQQRLEQEAAEKAQKAADKAARKTNKSRERARNGLDTPDKLAEKALNDKASNIPDVPPKLQPGGENHKTEQVQGKVANKET